MSTLAIVLAILTVGVWADRTNHSAKEIRDARAFGMLLMGGALGTAIYVAVAG